MMVSSPETRCRFFSVSNSRRTRSGAAGFDLRGTADGRKDPLVGAAAADVACHGGVDIGVGGARLAFEQRRSRHDLAGLAVAALRDVVLDPRLLYRVAAVLREALDGRDGLV